MSVDPDPSQAVLEGLSTRLPLVVDLDGTLLSSDMLHETFWSAFGRDWTVPLRAASALLQGRAALKRVLANAARVDVTTLPYNPAVIATVKDWRARGGRAVLVTASDADLAHAIAEHLGIFDEVHGSDGVRNLKAAEKAEFLNRRYGPRGYAYMGDSAADLKVWPHAARAITVNASAAVRQRLRGLDVPVADLQVADHRRRPLAAMLRPEHWCLALLALVPLLIGHDLSPARVAQGLFALVCVALVTSGAGVIRDLLTLEGDRSDPVRRDRPFAAGKASLAGGAVLAVALIALGLVAAALSGPVLAVLLLALVVVSALRTLWRPGPLADSLLSAAQATLPLLAGATVTGLPVPLWTLAFAALLFLAAAAVGRHIDPSRPATRRLGTPMLLATLLGSLILMAPTVLNSAPFLYYDTSSYIWYPHSLAHAALDLVRSGTPTETLTIFSGRSLHYGLFTYLSTALTQGWTLVWAQAAVLAWLVALSCRLFLPDGWIRASVLTAAGLAVLTPASFFVGLLTPDIWSGFLVTGVALLLAAREKLSGREIWALWIIVVFAALAHASHLALLLSMTTLGGLALLIPRLRPLLSGRTLATLLGAAVLGIAGQIPPSALTKTVTGQSPLALPHFTAHLVDLGPGTRLVQETCPQSGYAVCAFADRLPMDWAAFMFDDDPRTGAYWISEPAVQRALSAEQVGFLLDVVAAYPFSTLGGLALDGVEQLWTLSVEDVPMPPRKAEFLANFFQPELVEMTHASAMYNHPGLRHLVTALGYLSLAGSLLFAIALSSRSVSTSPLRHDLEATIFTFVGVVVIGLVLNALICGILASPYGRFQARLIWLLPFAVLVMGATRAIEFKTSFISRRPIA